MYMLGLVHLLGGPALCNVVGMGLIHGCGDGLFLGSHGPVIKG